MKEGGEKGGSGVHTSWCQPVKPESKDSRFHNSFVHHLLEHRFHLVHRNGRPRHSQNSVKLCRNECYSRLVCGFGKRLTFHSQPSNL